MSDTGWELLRVDAGSHRTPQDLPDAGWVPAVVPGGIGATLPGHADDADAHAWWLRRRVETGEGDHEIIIEGLGTYADVFLDGTRVARNTNAFRRRRVSVSVAPGDHELAVRIGALTEVTPPRKPRARWRSALLPDTSMRWHRTPHLGRIPSWQGAAPYVGIVARLDLVPCRPRLGELHARTEGTSGIVDVTVVGPLDGVVVHLGPDLTHPAPDGSARLVVPDAARWRPHTHGEPRTYDLRVERDGELLDRRTIGFCDIEIHDPDGVPRVTVDGIDVFVRGACWVPTDARSWIDDPVRIRADLEALRDAGVNALRITGTNRYERMAFWDMAAELGLLVWQDAMLATFDPPEDAEWLADLEAELREQLQRLQGRPNVLAVCGGTETEQQPTLMGLPAESYRMTAIHELLPRVVARHLPGTPHVVSSPSGGPLPTSISAGFSHYFGVGAYLRPVDDARAARVAFASEALAFAVPPERDTVRDDYPAGVADVRDQDWRDGVPSDRGVDWGFDDVTDHYVTALFGVRRGDVDADRWLDLERAAVADAMGTAFSAWRAPSSPTGGAFVLSHADLRRGPGWGLLDHRGRPKAPLLALRDVLAPTALLLVDHGLDGLVLDVVHDSPTPLDATLHVEAYAAGDRPVGTASLPVDGPRTVHVEQALGGFRDLTYAWRFGDRYYRAVRAWLTGHDGAVLAETTRLLGPPAAVPSDEPGLAADVRLATDDELHVEVTASALAEFVHLDAPGWRPDAGWFHLAPGASRTVRCRRVEADAPVHVLVRSTSHPPTGPDGARPAPRDVPRPDPA